MDLYQRFQFHYRIPLEPDCFDCLVLNLPGLLAKLLQAVQHGNVAMIKEYLEKDGDVNTTYEGECLLSRACSVGQDEIVQLLLQRADVHLNTKFEGCVPLQRAIGNGHMECVKFLIDTKVPCSIKYDNCWKGIAAYLRTRPQLQLSSATYMLRRALWNRHWDIVQPILEAKYDLTLENLYPLVLLAIDQNRWDIVYCVFEKEFFGKMDFAMETLAIAVRMKSWEKVDRLMHIIDSELKFEVAFAEAALSGRHLESQKLLAKGTYDSQTLNGNLMVVAAGGTNESVTDLMMSVKNIYTQRTFANAIFLACLAKNAELIPKLLHNPEASHDPSDLHKAGESLKRGLDGRTYDGFLRTYFSKYLENFMEIREGNLSS